jgi:hypothetical protein
MRRPRKLTEKENDDFILGAARTVDHPWNLVLEGWLRAIKAEERIKARTGPLKAKNQKRQTEAEDKYKEIRDSVREIIVKNPRLRRAKPYKLAKELTERFPQRRGWSTRTIQRALKR